MRNEFTKFNVNMSDGQVRHMLEKIGVEVESEDDTHLMILCPFHTNKHSAACSVAKNSGYYYCFNESCAARGTFNDLLAELKGWNGFRSLRFILSNRGPEKNYEQTINEIYASKEEMKEFDPGLFDQMRHAFDNNQEPNDYMKSRGMKQMTLDKYDVCYDPVRNMVMVPMKDVQSRCVGLVGRSIDGPKRFKNSVNLPTKKTLFGIDIAMKMNMDNVVICESSYDAMRVWQSGYASVATLGGSFSDYHKSQLTRYFDGVILMVDNDEPGRRFAEKIARGCKQRGLIVYQACYSPTELFPNNCKDASDCTDNQIRQMVKNKELYLTE